VWIAVHPDWRGRGLGRRLLEHLLAEADTERAWLVTHDLDTPARALYRSLGFHELGRGPLGWHDAERLVLGAFLPPGGRHRDPPESGPPVGEATSPAG
jgi:RimJ/RimL family protein N-acetyltransferase